MGSFCKDELGSTTEDEIKVDIKVCIDVKTGEPVIELTTHIIIVLLMTHIERHSPSLTATYGMNRD